jgi:tRNA nucleotidyltransferase/poly(A) polymerase
MVAGLKLTAEEESCFELLMRVQAFAGKNTVLRVAGGWVRDKVRHGLRHSSLRRHASRRASRSQVLGSSSHDIDIALDNVMGREFAESVKAYLSVRIRLPLALGCDFPHWADEPGLFGPDHGAS